MFSYFTNCFILRFVACPHDSFVEMLMASSSVFAERAALKLLEPGFPSEGPPETPPKPARPIPTDVPMPEPMDVPVPEPRDVPPPDPGTVPKPAKSDPKPRSVP